MSEYITKQQAIDLAESLRPIAGNGITDAFIKGIEGVEGRGPHLLPDMIGTVTHTEWNSYVKRNIKHIYFLIDKTWGPELIEAGLREAMQRVFSMGE